MTKLLRPEDLPQDPFLPQETPTGPTFLDTGACVCALQLPGANSDSVAWQCIGNQTQGVYTATTGKWFASLHGGTEDDGAIHDASNGPDTTKTLAWDRKRGSFVDADAGRLSVWDRACTGENHTSFSTSFYRAAQQLKDEKPPVDAAPCWRPGAVPLKIQSAEEWVNEGCKEGFLCKSCTLRTTRQGIG